MLFDDRHKLVRELVKPLLVKPGSKVSLPGGFDPGATAHFVHKEEADEALQQGVEMLAAYQARLAAEQTRGLLVVLQALDAAGKDGAVKHVMSGVNPQGVFVRSFKVPTDVELAHDYLWRYQAALPERGQIAIYNRSHYEEVLVVRVHPELLDRERDAAPRRGVWARRFEAINEWEKHLRQSGIHVVKLFLNVSFEEQRRRLLARIDDPDKNWKFSLADVRERASWKGYQKAYSEALTHTSTEWAPWHVIPADHKWFARLAVAGVIIHELMTMNPEYPQLGALQRAELEEARKQLS